MSNEESSLSLRDLSNLEKHLKNAVDDTYTEHESLKEEIELLEKQLQPKKDKLTHIRYLHDLYQNELSKMYGRVEEKRKDIGMRRK